ncbi:hypothetical protein Tco_1499567 [Tanacetum coccineum]
MAQHVILAAQLVPRYKSIGRCNNYAVLQSIPCSPECKIVGDTLHLPVETPDTPFVAPANIHTIEAFMNRVGYLGVVDKLIIADLMKKFPSIPKRLEEDYHSIKDDVPLTKKRKQITRESSSSRKLLNITIKQKEIVDAEKNDVDSEDRLEPGSHKENPEVVDDDDDNAREKKDDTMGSLEIRNEEMQTTNSTPIRSPRKSLSSDKQIFQELTDTVSIPTTTTSKHSHVKKIISSKYSHLPGALRRMCRRQGYMIQDMEQKCVTTEKFLETHNKVDQVLKEVIPEIAENVVNDLIEYNLKPCIAETIIEDRDAFRSDIPAFVSHEFKTHAPKIITEHFKEYVQSNVIHDHLTTILSTTPDSLVELQYQLEDEFHSHHDEHQDDDAPLEGGENKSNAWEEENVFDEDEVIPEDVTSELIAKFQNVDKRVPTIFDHARMEAKLRDSLEEFLEPDLEEKLNRWVRKEFKTFNEDAWITEVVRIITDQPHGLDFMEQILVMRANDKPNSFSEVDFKYLNKNDIEDLYYLCRSKEINNRKIKLMNSLITFIRSCVIWERVHDFQLGIESYQMKVNLTAPIIKFPSIEEHAPYSIVDEPQMGLIYLNSKAEKRVMYLEEIVKFCDATLEKVLKEVKIIMFESQFLKKPPLLGHLDQDIMKAYEREISKRLSHRQQIQRWESFVNGRSILPKRKCL